MDLFLGSSVPLGEIGVSIISSTGNIRGLDINMFQFDDRARVFLQLFSRRSQKFPDIILTGVEKRLINRFHQTAGWSGLLEIQVLHLVDGTSCLGVITLDEVEFLGRFHSHVVDCHHGIHSLAIFGSLEEGEWSGISDLATKRRNWRYVDDNSLSSDRRSSAARGNSILSQGRRKFPYPRSRLTNFAPGKHFSTSVGQSEWSGRVDVAQVGSGGIHLTTAFGAENRRLNRITEKFLSQGR